MLSSDANDMPCMHVPCKPHNLIVELLNKPQCVDDIYQSVATDFHFLETC